MLSAKIIAQHARYKPFHPGRPTLIPLQTVQIQMRPLIMSRLIRIYTVCHPVFDFRLKPLFALVDKSELKNRWVSSEFQGWKDSEKKKKKNAAVFLFCLLNFSIIRNILKYNTIFAWFSSYFIYSC